MQHDNGQGIKIKLGFGNDIENAKSALSDLLKNLDNQVKNNPLRLNIGNLKDLLATVKELNKFNKGIKINVIGDSRNVNEGMQKLNDSFSNFAKETGIKLTKQLKDSIIDAIGNPEIEKELQEQLTKIAGKDISKDYEALNKALEEAITLKKELFELDRNRTIDDYNMRLNQSQSKNVDMSRLSSISGLGSDEFQNHILEVKENAKEISNVLVKTYTDAKTGQEELTQATIVYTDKLGKTITETLRWREVGLDDKGREQFGFGVVNTAYGDNIEKRAKEEAKLLKEIEKSEKAEESRIEVLNRTNVQLNKELDSLDKLSDAFSKFKNNTYIDKESDNYKKLNAQIDNARLNVEKLGRLKNTEGNDFVKITDAENYALNKQKKEIEELIQAVQREANEKARISKLGSYALDISNIKDDVFSRNVVSMKSAEQELKRYTSALLGAKVESVKLGTVTENAGNKVRTFVARVKEGKDTYRDFTFTADEATKAMYTVNTATKDASTTSLALGHNLGKAIARMVQWAVAGGIVYGVVNQLKSMVRAVVEIDSTMVGIRKVMDLTNDEFERMRVNASEVGKELGKTTVEVLKATELWAKAGFGKVSEELAKVTLLASNVGDISVEDSQKIIMATNAGFQRQAEDSIQIIDMLNNISNKNAVTIEAMGNALERSASTAHLAGMSLEEYVAIVGTGIATTQRAGEEIGNSWKTIIMRMQGVQDETESTVEDISNVESALRNVGIEVRDGVDSFRPAMNVLKDLHGVWSGLSDIQKSYIAEQMAGKRQADIFKATMQNFTMVEKQYGEAMQSSGSAMRENQTYMNSIEAKMAQFKATWESLAQTIISSDWLKSIIESFTGFLETIDRGTKGLGVMTPVVIVATVALEALAVAFMKNNVQLLAKGTFTLKNAFMTLIPSIFGATGGINAMNASLMWTNILTGGIMIAIGALTVGLFSLAGAEEKAKEENAELVKSMEEQYEAGKKNLDYLDQALPKYKKLAELESTNSLTTEQTEDLLDMRKQMKDIIPDIVAGYTEENKAIYKSTEAIDDMVESLREQNAEMLKSTYWRMDVSENAKEIHRLSEELNNMEVKELDYKLNQDIYAYIRGLQDELISKGQWNENFEGIEEYVNKVKTKINEVENAYAKSTGKRDRYFESQNDEFTLLLNRFDDNIWQDRIQTLKNFNTQQEDTAKKIDENKRGIIERLQKWNKSLYEDMNIEDGNIKLLGDRIAENFIKNAKIDEKNLPQLEENYRNAIEKVFEGLQNVKTSDVSALNKYLESANFSGIDKNVAEQVRNTIMLQVKDLQAVIDEKIRLDEINKKLGLSEAQVMKKISDTKDTMNTSIKKTKELLGIREEISKGNLSPETIATIMENYQELMPYMNNEITLRKAINDLIQKEGEFQKETYANILSSSETYYTSVKDKEKDKLKTLAELRKADLKDCVTLAKAKERIESATVKSFLEKWGGWYDPSTDSYLNSSIENYAKDRGYDSLIKTDLAELRKQEAENQKVYDNILKESLDKFYKSLNDADKDKKAQEQIQKARQEFEKWMDSVRDNTALLDYSLAMNQLNREFAEASDNHNESNKLLIQENGILKGLNKTYQDNINLLTSKRGYYSKSSEEYKEIQQAIEEYSKSIRQNEIAIIENNNALKEWDKTLRENILNAEELVLDAIKERDDKRKESLEKEKDELKESIKANYEASVKKVKDAKESYEKQYNLKKEQIQKEKDLLQKEFDESRNKNEEDKRNEELMNLQKKYNELSLDNSGRFEQEKLALKEQIKSLQEEIFWDLKEKEVKSQQEALDEKGELLDKEHEQRISKYEQEEEELKRHYDNMDKTWSEFYNKRMSDIDKELEKLNKTQVQYWSEVDSILKKSQSDIISFLMSNTNAYAEAGRTQAEAYKNEWKDVIDMFKQIQSGALKTSSEVSKSIGTANTSSSSSSKSSSTTTSSSKTSTTTKPTTKNYTVKKGDSLSKIASANKTTVSNLMKLNPSIKDADEIWAGDVIKIPAYKKGGLIDFTGLAWVDGTKKDPEGILNAEQTKIFKTFAENLTRGRIDLPQIKTPTFAGTSNSGGIQINNLIGKLDLNVAKLENDTDFNYVGKKVTDYIYKNTIEKFGTQLSVRRR